MLSFNEVKTESLHFNIEDAVAIYGLYNETKLEEYYSDLRDALPLSEATMLSTLRNFAKSEEKEVSVYTNRGVRKVIKVEKGFKVEGRPSIHATYGKVFAVLY